MVAGIVLCRSELQVVQPVHVHVSMCTQHHA